MQAGKMTATLRLAGLKEIQLKTGHQALLAYLEFETTATQETVEFSCFLSSEKSIAFAMKTLKTCGWQGTTLEHLADLNEGQLDTDKTYSITVEEVTNEKGTYYRVKWIDDGKSDRAVPTKASALDMLKKATGQAVSETPKADVQVSFDDLETSKIPF